MKRALPAILFGAILAGAAAAPRAEVPDRWLERLQTRLDGIRAFQARFVQEYEPRAFSRRQVESGTVTFLRPGRMRWEYQSPRPKLALCDGRRAWVYYPDEKRAEREPLERLGEDAPAVHLLLGRWRLKERFRLEGISRHDGEITLHLAPGRRLEAIEAVRVTVAEADLGLRAVEVQQTGGDLLRYRFEEWTEAVDPPEAMFHFEPPEGVVVRGEP